MSPIGAPRPVFDPRWQDRLASSMERTMVATVQIYDPKSTTATYNPATGEYTSVPSVVYEGKARVQPIRSANDKNNTGNATTVQTVLISIPLNSLDIRPWHRAKVTSSPLNPSLCNFVYAAKEIMDSSNPLERTYYFTVDQEATNA